MAAQKPTNKACCPGCDCPCCQCKCPYCTLLALVDQLVAKQVTPDNAAAIAEEFVSKQCGCGES